MTTWALCWSQGSTMDHNDATGTARVALVAVGID